MSTTHVSELPDPIGFTVCSFQPNHRLQSITHDSGYITVDVGPVQLTMSPGNWSFVQEIIGDALKAIAETHARTHTIVFDDANGTAKVVSK